MIIFRSSPATGKTISEGFILTKSTLDYLPACDRHLLSHWMVFNAVSGINLQIQFTVKPVFRATPRLHQVAMTRSSTCRSHTWATVTRLPQCSAAIIKPHGTWLTTVRSSFVDSSGEQSWILVLASVTLWAWQNIFLPLKGTQPLLCGNLPSKCQ